MLCPNCNKTVEEAFKFCPYCRAELDRSRFKVEQEIGSVEGSAAGAVVSEDAASQGIDLSVKQKVDKVESGGAMAGAVVGGEGGNIHIGSKQHTGDTVEGDKVMGDKVEGDKIEIDKVNAGDGGAVAIGKGSTAVGARGVNVGGSVGGSIVTGSNVEISESGAEQDDEDDSS